MHTALLRGADVGAEQVLRIRVVLRRRLHMIVRHAASRLPTARALIAKCRLGAKGSSVLPVGQDTIHQLVKQVLTCCNAELRTEAHWYAAKHGERSPDAVSDSVTLCQRSFTCKRHIKRPGAATHSLLIMHTPNIGCNPHGSQAPAAMCNGSSASVSALQTQTQRHIDTSMPFKWRMHSNAVIATGCFVTSHGSS